MKSTRVLGFLVLGLLLALSLCLAATGPLTRVAAAPPSPAVCYAINNGASFQVSASPIATAVASSTIDNNGFRLYINPSGYADTGIVLYFDGSLTLGALDNLSITGSGAGYAANLWLDVGGDNHFFSFTGEVYNNVDGDTYGTVANSSSGALQISDGSIYHDQNGYGDHTLAEMKSGSLGWVNSGTKVAIWIGNSGSTTETTHLATVVVNGSSPTPAPFSTYQVPTATGTGMATFWPGSCPMQSLTELKPSTLPAPPGNLVFPDGMFSFDIAGVTPNGTATVTIDLPSGIPANAGYWICDRTSKAWSQIGYTRVSANEIAITLSDDGRNGDQIAGDGIINDPGGLGGPSGGGGGATSAPVFPSIYTGIGAALAAGIGAYLISRRFARQ